MVDVDSSLIFGRPELGVTVARSKASDLGVSVADVAETLRVLVGGVKVSAFDDGGEQYDGTSAPGRATVPTRRASAASTCRRTASVRSLSRT